MGRSEGNPAQTQVVKKETRRDAVWDQMVGALSLSWTTYTHRYIYIYIYVYMYMCVYMYMYMFMCICTCIYVSSIPTYVEVALHGGQLGTPCSA